MPKPSLAAPDGFIGTARESVARAARRAAEIRALASIHQGVIGDLRG